MSSPDNTISGLPVREYDETYNEIQKSIFQNSCSKCNERKIHLFTGDESPCHDFRCQKNILSSTEGEVTEPSAVTVSQDLIERAVQTISVSPCESAIDSLPQELLACVFDLLDLYSLCLAGDVCTRWRDLAQSSTYQKVFEKSFDKLWPRPFRQWYPVMDHKVFSNLLYSVNCSSCFLQDRDIMAGSSIYRVADRKHNSLYRITSELKELPPNGITILPVNDDRLDKLIATIKGPKDSPFENGIFYISITFTELNEYPFRAPSFRFLTKIFHPAVSCHGHISLDLLGPAWAASLTMRSILLCIHSMMLETDVELCEQTPVGKLFKENRAEYERIARIWTQKFATQHLIYPTCDPE